jgi:hypothetical protein
MPIKVSVSSISNEELQLILDYYNSHKDILEEPLELLNRCEGGFQIAIPYMKNQQTDANNKVKQVRWNRGYLLSTKYIHFKNHEELLLYQSLAHVLGEKNVFLKDDVKWWF